MPSRPSVYRSSRTKSDTTLPHPFTIGVFTWLRTVPIGVIVSIGTPPCFCTSYRVQEPKRKPTRARFGWRVLASCSFQRRLAVCVPVVSDCQRHRGPQRAPCRNILRLRRSSPFPYQRQRTLADTIARYRLRVPPIGRRSYR